MSKFGQFGLSEGKPRKEESGCEEGRGRYEQARANTQVGGEGGCNCRGIPAYWAILALLRPTTQEHSRQ